MATAGSCFESEQAGGLLRARDICPLTLSKAPAYSMGLLEFVLAKLWLSESGGVCLGWFLPLFRPSP